jgi:MFS transporter, ENTS family, enterobactin (siderophore) exporter
VIPDPAQGLAAPSIAIDDDRPEPLGENRDFRTLLIGQGISAVGDAVSFTALPLLVLILTGSGLAMGIVGVLESIPDLVFGMVAGVFADRWDRRRMMLVADVGRACLTALIPLSVVVGAPTLVVVFLVAAPMSVLRSVFLAAYTASLPNLVGRSQLARANSIFEAIYSFGYILGPGLAGLLVATIGAAQTIAIDAASYAASSVALFFIRRPLTARRDHPPLDLVAEMRVGIAYVASHRVLRDAIAFWGLVSVISAGLVPAVAYYVVQEQGQEASVLGLILSAYGLGAFLGAILTSRLRMRRAGRLMLGGNLVRGLALVAIVAVGSIGAMVGAALIAGIVDSVVLITYITLRAAASTDEVIGRVGGTARTISLGLQPIGYITAGLLIDAIGGGVTLATIGLALAATSGLFVLSRPLRDASAASR